MNRLIFILLAAMAAAPFVWKHFNKTAAVANLNNSFIKKKKEAKATEFIRLQNFADKLEQYARENNYNTRYCFLIDMTIACGSNRFFVYDIQKDSVLQSGLVTHGYGNSNYTSVNFSNVPGSNSSSLGKYKVGYSYNGKFGLAYKLYGLNKTNDNAFNRFVVLHSHECVPATEVAPQPICMSQGCPTVSPSFLKMLSPYVDGADKPVLLWIFN
jgi:hypothetical protein